MRVRAALKTATDEAHRRVDAAFSRFDLAGEAGYRRFLLAQAEGLIPVEAALDAAGAERLLPDWPARRRAALLRADLEALNVTLPEPFPAPAFISAEASMLGAIYVLEGSRLGGAVLERAVPRHFPRRFLGARQTAGGWRSFLRRLDDLLSRTDDLDAATVAAREVFARFERAANAQLETEPRE